MNELKKIIIEKSDETMVIIPHATTEIEFTKEYTTELVRNCNKHFVYEPNEEAQRKLVKLTIDICDGQGLEGVIIDE